MTLYTQYGGDSKKVDALLQPYGFTAQELRNNYERLYGNGGADYIEAGAPLDEATLRSYAEEIARYAEIANELSGLSASDYAARTEDEHLVDSMLSHAIDFYLSEGGSMAELEKYENFKKLDRKRSRCLGEQFMANHPEMQ